MTAKAYTQTDRQTDRQTDSDFMGLTCSAFSLHL